MIGIAYGIIPLTPLQANKVRGSRRRAIFSCEARPAAPCSAMRRRARGEVRLFRFRFGLETKQFPNGRMQAPFAAFPLLPRPQRRVDHGPGLGLRQAGNLSRGPDRIRRRVSRRIDPAAPVWVVSHVKSHPSIFRMALHPIFWPRISST